MTVTAVLTKLLAPKHFAPFPHLTRSVTRNMAVQSPFLTTLVSKSPPFSVEKNFRRPGFEDVCLYAWVKYLYIVNKYREMKVKNMRIRLYLIYLYIYVYIFIYLFIRSFIL